MAAPQMPHIEKLFAFLSVDNDADEALVDSLRSMAEILAKNSGMRIRLAEFSQRTDLEWIE